MPGPRLIDAYLHDLRRQLPADVVAELADGLHEAHEHFLRQGLPPHEAAQAAVADFGTPREVITAFSRNAPGRRLATRLLATGPLVGGCWAAVLLTDPSWHTLPSTARLLFPLLLLSVITLLAVAWRGPYARIRPAAQAASLGLLAVDATAIAAVITAGLVPSLLPGLAVCASITRITLTGRALPTVARSS
jgi:hypothetical protein